ncbi:MAG: hypothetical protein AB8I08_12145 [Sandaracinaceae bacterium]
MANSKTLAVLIAEQNAGWGGWLDSLRAEADEVAVVLQRQGESPSALAMRVRACIEEKGRDSRLLAAALVGADGFDSSTLGSRSLMIRTLVSEMVASGEGQLFLDAGTSSGRGRFAMQALASVVEDQIVDTGVNVMTVRGPQRTIRRAA